MTSWRSRRWGFPTARRPETASATSTRIVMFASRARSIEPGLLRRQTADSTIEPIDQTGDPRKTWVSTTEALRRVLRLPYVAYDFPAPDSDNLRTVDEFDLFIGPPDRFEWTLLGKRELYIPYNAYRLHGDAVGADDILRTATSTRNWRATSCTGCGWWRAC